MDKLDQMIADLAAEMKPEVLKIEARPATTKDHYGDYMGILGQIKDKRQAQIGAIALIDAGANKAGVGWAMRILGHV